MSTNQNKFLTQGPTMPWKLSSAFDSSILCTGDFDGDGLDEILVMNSQETNCYGAISILSYLQLSELDSALPTGPTFCVQWNSATGFPNWNYPSDIQIGQLSSFIYLVVDTDNDGCDEIIAFLPSLSSNSSSTPQLGVLKWVNSALSCVWQTNECIDYVDGEQSITIANDMQFISYSDKIFPNKNAILSIQLGESIDILSWSDSSLKYIWSNANTIFGYDGQANWSLSVEDQFVVGDIDGDGSDEIIIFVPNGQLAVAKYIEDSIKIIGYLTASSTQSINQDCVSNVLGVYIADLGNTGTVKVTLKTSTNNIYVLTWNDSSFSSIWNCQSTMPGTTSNNDYLLYFGDSSDFFSPQILYPITLPDTGAGFFVYSGNCGAIFSWQKNGLVCSWMTGNITDFTLPNSIYYNISVQDEQRFMIAIDPNSALIFLNVSSIDVKCTYQLSAVQGWSLSFIADLPQTTFTDFTGENLDIYKYISMKVNPQAPGPKQDGDLRSEYSNLNYDRDFEGWSGQISSMDIGPNFSADNWKIVTSILAKETALVSVAYTINSNACDLAGAIKSQQTIDLDHCFGNMSLDDTAATNSTPYWPGAIVDAILWGLAACPVDPGFQIGFAIAASLFGAYMSEPDDDSSATVTTVQYCDFASTVDSLFLNAIQGNYFNLSVIVTDPVKLKIIGILSGEAWMWTIKDYAETISLGSNYNRIIFYKMLIPAELTLFTWTNYPSNNPSYMYGTYPCSTNNISGVPSYATGNSQNDVSNPIYNNGYSSSYNIWMLAQGSMNFDSTSSDYNIVAYPSSNLTTDLFDTLQVNPWNLYNGLYNWNTIQQALYVMPNSCIWSGDTE